MSSVIVIIKDLLASEPAKFAGISRDPQAPLSGLNQYCTVLAEQYVHSLADCKWPVPGDPGEKTRK
jgi:hypothetical protein